MNPALQIAIAAAIAGSGLPSTDTDPYPSNVKLLFHAEGANGGTTFTETRGLALSVSSGAPTTSTALAKYGSSSLNNGTGTNGGLISNYDADLVAGTGDFCLEAWVYQSANQSAAKAVVAIGAAGSNVAGLMLGVDANRNVVARYASGLVTLITSSNTISNGQWNHIALTRSGTTMTVWVNGISGGTASDSSSWGGGVAAIGSTTGGAAYYAGYIDDVRITVGQARYTTNFAPSTVQFPDTGVLPYTGDPYFPNVVLLLHADGADNATTGTDSSSLNQTLTFLGTTKLSQTQKKFGTAAINSSGGGTSRIQTNSTTAGAFGTGDFTIEGWVYLTTIVNYAVLVATNSTGGGQAGTWWMEVSNGRGLHLVAESTDINFGGTFTANTWTHVAISRNGSSLRAFKDGVQVGSTQTISANFNSTNTLVVGNHNLGSGSQGLTGYIDDLRVTKGVGRYTANFTPPAAAFPNS